MNKILNQYQRMSNSITFRWDRQLHLVCTIHSFFYIQNYQPTVRARETAETTHITWSIQEVDHPEDVDLDLLFSKFTTSQSYSIIRQQ